MHGDDQQKREVSYQPVLVSHETQFETKTLLKSTKTESKIHLNGV